MVDFQSKVEALPEIAGWDNSMKAKTNFGPQSEGCHSEKTVRLFLSVWEKKMMWHVLLKPDSVVLTLLCPSVFSV